MSEPKRVRRCRWYINPWLNYWHSGCGHDWCFTDDGGPENNAMRYCPFCGKRLREMPHKE